MKKLHFYSLISLMIVGLADAIFLTYEKYALTNVGCPVSPLFNCLAVATSKYSEIFGIPLAVLGVIYYLFMIFFLYKGRSEKMFRHFLLITSSFGALFSIYLIFVQAVLIKVFCFYCLLSAAISFFILGLTMIFFEKDWKTLILDTFGYAYSIVLKPILFKFDAEKVHVAMVTMGENLPKFILNIFKSILVKKYKNLNTKYLGINFINPIGLAAGFDYEARLTQTLPFIGFGFQSVGTITNIAYGGNPTPRLGRLPKSKSLLVNKGYKNLGIKETADKLAKLRFRYPVGLSIGRTNAAELDTVEKSIKDIVGAFKYAKSKKLKIAYYELNISCPNLINNLHIDFYNLKNLDVLLTAVDKLRLDKPLFIKMPIDQTDRHTKAMTKVIADHKVQGLIIGNLQTNKNNKVIIKKEANKFKMGKYSGKPTFEDSNRIIKLLYKNFKDRFIIVGVGGVFNADDAWVKFTNGANLVQLITGMIYEGPQLIAQINRDLSERLTKEGYKTIKEIVGIAV